MLGHAYGRGYSVLFSALCQVAHNFDDCIILMSVGPTLSKRRTLASVH